MATATRNRAGRSPGSTIGSMIWRAAPAWLCLLAGTLAADSLLAGKRGNAHDPAADRQQARDTAVALNYCRTSFHRIRSYPTKRVLLEEQQKILNNLNLNGIADEEVVRLYTAVLAEISEVQIAERERIVIQQRHRRVFYRQLSLTAFELTGQLATARFASAVRTGAASWWDFRAMGWHTELDTWQLEKEQLAALTDKSALFLDTFWKLARKRDIPDRWLVRSNDLSRLEEAVREPDLAVRLRILKRMEKFMECYPPYWYYLGRTQQQLGQLFAAAETYHRLVEVGRGHFRKDDMLAAGMVNRALIQQYLKQPSAGKTAHEALQFSTDGWEVNLLGADVLRRHERFEEAEDAILRNLDNNLERPQSLAALLGLYFHWKQKDKLSGQLASLDVIRDVPIRVLLQTARLLSDERLPAPLVAHLQGSLTARTDLHFGRDDLVFSAWPAWELQTARVSVVAGKQTFDKPEQSDVREHREIRFRRVLELGSPLQPAAGNLPLLLVMNYAATPPIRVHLHQGPAIAGTDNSPLVADDPLYRIVRIDVGDVPLWLVPVNRPETPPVSKPPPAPVKSPTTPPSPAAPAPQPADSVSPAIPPLLVPPAPAPPEPAAPDAPEKTPPQPVE